MILKQSEAIVYNDILVPWWKMGRWVEPILQVHDCLKLETEDGLQNELNVLMRRAMTEVPNGFSVPLDVAGEWGYNTADMVSFGGK